VAEQYIGRFGELAKAGNTIILPANVADVASMLAVAMNVIGRRPGDGGPGAAGGAGAPGGGRLTGGMPGGAPPQAGARG
jgi:hypothetical protein